MICKIGRCLIEFKLRSASGRPFCRLTMNVLLHAFQSVQKRPPRRQEGSTQLGRRGGRGGGCGGGCGGGGVRRRRWRGHAPTARPTPGVDGTDGSSLETAPFFLSIPSRNLHGFSLEAKTRHLQNVVGHLWDTDAG